MDIDAASLIAKLLTHCTPNQVVPAVSPSKPFNGLAFVGIAPGGEEVMEGIPFIGPSGRIFNKCLTSVGIDRDASWVGNLCPVRLSMDRGLARHEVQVLRIPLIESLREVQPKLIVTLGAEPTRAFFPENDIEIMLMRSHIYECPELPGTHILPTIHPAFALRQSLSLVALLLNDFLIAKNFLNGVPRYRPWTYEDVTSIQDLQTLLYKHKGELMALDSEATDKNPFTAVPFMLSFAFESNPNHGYVIHTPFKNYNPDLGAAELLDGRDSPTPIEEVYPIFQKANPKTIIQNMLYDYVLLRRFGYEPQVFVDTMYAFALLDENCPRGLDNLGSFFSGIAPYSMDYASLDLTAWKPYAACDAINVLRVWQALERRFVEPGMQYLLHDYLMPLLVELAHASIRGVPVDLQKLSKVDKDVSTEIARNVSTMQAVAGQAFNHKSGDQLAEVFSKLGIPVLGKTKKTKKPSFKKELLEKIQDRYPFVKLLLETKKLDKLYSSYVKNLHKYLDAEHQVHPNFDIKKTGRLSAKEPALQTLPRKSVILEMFTAKPGRILIKCDFSAAELRWLGFLAGEERWLQADVDLHVSNASFFYQIPREEVTPAMRTQVKFLGFGKVYGSGLDTLARQLNCSLADAQRMDDKFFTTFPKIGAYMEQCKEFVLKNAYLKNWFGLERHFAYDLLFGNEQDEARVIREAYNFGPQSTVAMWTNMSLVKIQKWLEANLPNSAVILQIHDAIIVDAAVEDLYTAMYAMWKIMRRTIDERTRFFLPIDVCIGPDLKHQVEVIPFDAVDFDKAYDKFKAAA